MPTVTNSVRVTIAPSGKTIHCLCVDASENPAIVTGLANGVAITGDGTGALAIVTGWDAAGGIAAITVYDGGSGYTSATAALTNGVGSGAVLGAVAVSGGKVQGVAITTSGTGYGPTASINGGPAFGLSDPIWGMDSGSASPKPYWPVVLFPLDAALKATDVLDLTVPDGFLSAAGGPLAGLGTIRAASAVGGSLLPPFVPSPKTMRAGANINGVLFYGNLNIYADMLRQSSGFANPGPDGLPIGPFPDSTILVQSQADPTDPLGYPNSAADGTWTIVWDGDIDANPQLTVTAATVSLLGTTPGANNVGHTRTYRITADQLQSHHPGAVSLKVNAAGATRIAVYPPGEATDGSSKFGVNLLRQANGLKCIRFMGALRTNSSCQTEFADFAPPDLASVGAGTLIGGHVASFGPYTPTDAWFDQSTFCSFAITFTAPHGCATGQVLQTNPFVTGPNPDGSWPTTSGVTIAASRMRNHRFAIRVLDELRIAVELVGGGATGTLTQTTAQPDNAQMFNSKRQGVPIADCAEFCNALGADCWINVPHAASDDCITQMARTIAANLDAGLKCFVEFTNEAWNTALGYEQFWYMTQYARTFPGSGATAAASVDSKGHVNGLTLTAPGSGYVMAPDLTIAPSPTGSVAKGHTTLIGGELAVELDSGGAGYDPGSPPAVTISAGLNEQAAYIYLMKNAHAIFAAEFAAAGRSADLVRVLGSQFHVPGLTNQLCRICNNNGITFDAACVATYWANSFDQDEPALATAFDRLDVEMLHDFTAPLMLYGGHFSRVPQHRANLDANGFPAAGLLNYEGGPGPGVNEGSNDLAHRSVGWGRHPRMRDAMLYFFQLMNDMGVATYCDEILWAGIAPPYPNWGTYLGRLELAGRGDGSDGLFDNRTNYYDLSKIVSVKGLAFNVWNGVVSDQGGGGGGGGGVPGPSRSRHPLFRTLLRLGRAGGRPLPPASGRPRRVPGRIR